MNNVPGPDNPIEARLRELLLLWEEARERGEILSAAELCRDCPELEPELARRIESLRLFDPLNEPSLPTSGNGQASRPPGPPPELAAITLDLTDLQFHAQR